MNELARGLQTGHFGLLVLGAALGGLGMWRLLPRGGMGSRRLGLLLGLAGLGLFGWQLPKVGNVGEHGLFLALAAVTVVAAAATVTARNPVYSAIWFALSLLGTAGLFLCQGAQFLGVATVVVYAGAILVTFLFVLMLANPSGQAHYDRLSWEAPLSAGAGAVLVGILTAVLAGSLPSGAGAQDMAAVAESHGHEHGAGGHSHERSSAHDHERRGGVLDERHMESLGAQLFSRHLISLEVAGTLLLVALVGSVAITAHGKGPRTLPEPTGLEEAAHG